MSRDANRKIYEFSGFRLDPAQRRREVLPKAKEAALKALEIDENLAEAHSSLDLLRVYYDHDWPAAEKEFKRSLELSPDLVLSHQRYGSYLTFQGRFEEAIDQYEHALKLDPFSLHGHMNLATAYYLMGEYQQAIGILEKTLELESSSTVAASPPDVRRGYASP